MPNATRRGLSVLSVFSNRLPSHRLLATANNPPRVASMVRVLDDLQINFAPPLHMPANNIMPHTHTTTSFVFCFTRIVYMNTSKYIHIDIVTMVSMVYVNESVLVRWYLAHRNRMHAHNIIVYCPATYRRCCYVLHAILGAESETAVNIVMIRLKWSIIPQRAHSGHE